MIQHTKYLVNVINNNNNNNNKLPIIIINCLYLSKHRTPQSRAVASCENFALHQSRHQDNGKVFSYTTSELLFEM